MKKAMIVEDYEIHRTIISHILEDMQYEVLPLSDVEQAKEILRELRPDIFILDIKIKESYNSILGFIKELRTRYNYSEKQIIVITAYLNEEEVRTSLSENNIKNIVPKPFTVDELAAKITEVNKYLDSLENK